MEEKPLVTAVVTTYKREPEMVGRALKSVAAQTYPNMEIILVNDCPEDKELSKKLEQLCQGFERKVNYAPMKQNGGANAARNHGAELSKGEFIAFLDDDDEWLPEKITLQMEKMRDENVAIVYGNFWVDTEKTHSRFVEYKNPRPEGDLYAKMFYSNVIGSTSFPLIRKKAFDEAGGFDNSVPALQDMELWLRIVLHYRAAYVHEPIGVYYFYSGNRISAHPERRINGYEHILKYHSEYLEQHKNEKAGFDLMGVTFYINGRKFKHAFKLWAEAVRLRPLKLKDNLYFLIKIIIRFFIPAKIV